MTLRVKGWSKFQHYKRRRPPWIRLYRDLLDDHDWNALSGEQVKVLVALWLIASEDNGASGELPASKVLAWRLRMEIKDLEAILPCLSHFLEGDASDMLASCKQNATPETETEAETDLLSTGSADERFRSFWEQYPRKESKLDAEKAFRNLTVTNQRAALSAVGTWPFAKERNYQPLPAGWLRKQRWNDETTTGVDEDAYGGLVVR